MFSERFLLKNTRIISGIRGELMVDIIICVHNALEYVKECLESVVIHGGYNKIIIVNDFSESVTKDWLCSYCITEKGRGIHLINNDTNLGYTKSANIGLQETDADYVILLNSDTLVTSDWITNMLKCYNAYPRTGIVGPLTNNGGWQSFNLKDMDIAFCLGEIKPSYPRVKLVNGFCYMICRKVIEEVGYLDELSFPIGYGEEDDFSIRAQDKGFELRIVDNAFVYHEKSKSFDLEQIPVLKKAGYETLCKKHGKYKVNRLIYEMNVNQDIKRLKRELKRCINKRVIL